jgi:hypothetical protein
MATAPDVEWREVATAQRDVTTSWMATAEQSRRVHHRPGPRPSRVTDRSVPRPCLRRRPDSLPSQSCSSEWDRPVVFPPAHAARLPTPTGRPGRNRLCVAASISVVREDRTAGGHATVGARWGLHEQRRRARTPRSTSRGTAGWRRRFLRGVVAASPGERIPATGPSPHGSTPDVWRLLTTPVRIRAVGVASGGFRSRATCGRTRRT